jgi:PIN domain nuclease of toxin-antitoxin system
MLNLDTHILLHALTGDLKLRERTTLAGDSWSISAIVLWELAMLARLGRIEYDVDDSELSAVLSRIHVWPLDLPVVRKLKELDFTSDPADEIIAATSLVHQIPLVTRDRNIRRSRLIRFAG